MKERSKYDLKPFSIIGLKFLDKQNLPSGKTYEYFMDEKLTDWFFSIRSSDLSAFTYQIVNENDYNYRESKVVIHYWRKVEAGEAERTDLLYLRAITKCALAPDETKIWDGSTPFDKKENTMNFDGKTINKICLNGETYNLSNNTTLNKAITSADEADEVAKTINDSWSNISTSLEYNPRTDCATSIDWNDNLGIVSTYSPLIHFDSNGITIGDEMDINCNYEKVYDKLEKVKLEKNRKETEKMFENVMKNFKFGPCGPKVKMSMYGPAFISEGNTYVAFDADNEPIDVTGMTFDFNCMYMMPVGVDDVVMDDYIYHKDKPVKVVDVTERGNFVCIDVFNKEEITVVPVKSPFGFNFLTKLVNFGEGVFGANTIDESNPFGSMLPFMMMSQNKGGNDNMMLMAMMMGQNKMEMNPMMMYALMSDGKSNDMLPLMVMMSQNTHKCECGGKCKK